ncbi:Transcriptional regulator, GntR family [uncultured Alphaproteobacteria bacterium]|uniref:Transcriptional regulator, GntR family n=1 Tax=uncultured Alphaproteobacteria bacterium TaxID=91750 RepID=A0A212KL37_9PROT|nr:Transcriptional regulator, GntR family [uncultured Alphaproteobacteria bacterium]
MSLADQVSAALEKEIVLGELAPGLHLDEGSLADRFGTSRTPVREALARLAASGLVELRPRRGAAVAAIDDAAMAQRFEALAGLEGLCAYYAAERMTAEQRLALRDAHRRCRGPAESGELDRYDAADMIFHRLLMEGCRNDILIEQTIAVRRLVKPWRRLQLAGPGRIDAAWREHEAIVAAVAAGHAAEAERLTRAHVDHQGEAADKLLGEAARGGESQSMP